jgi:hypothetical protein
MRMRYVTYGWLCSLVVCCAGTTMAQSFSGNVSAVEDGSAGSSVSASVNASVNAGVSEAASSNSASRSGSGSRSASMMNALAISPSNAANASPNAGMSADSAAQSDGPGVAPALTNVRAGLSSAELRTGRGKHPVIYRKSSPASRQTVTAHNLGEPAKQSTGLEGAPVYSEGFADSTKGTALISPPDLGTASPLDWTPGLNFEFPDFTQTSFLNPTLHTSVPRKGARVRGRKAPQAEKILGEPALSTSIDEELGIKVPSAEQDILGSKGPSTSIDEELGLH